MPLIVASKTCCGDFIEMVLKVVASGFQGWIWRCLEGFWNNSSGGSAGSREAVLGSSLGGKIEVQKVCPRACSLPFAHAKITSE